MRSWQKHTTQDNHSTQEGQAPSPEVASRGREIGELYDPDDPEETRRRVRAELDRIYAGVTGGARAES